MDDSTNLTNETQLSFLAFSFNNRAMSPSPPLRDQNKVGLY